MKYGLKDSYLQNIIHTLQEYKEIKEAFIFGSRAKGNYQDSSDIDIALKGDINLKLIAKLKAVFEESNIPYFVDIVSYENAPLGLKESIDKNSKAIKL